MQIMMADLTEEVRDLKGEMRSFQSFCKDSMDDRFVRSRFNENDLWVATSKSPIVRNSVFFRDLEKPTKRDILDGKAELMYYEEWLNRPNLSVETINQVRTQISALKNMLRKAGQIEFKDY